MDALIRALKRTAHATNKMPTGGRHGTPKGKRGYTRKEKHRNVHR